MECPHCKKILPPNASRCPNCGNEIGANVHPQNASMWMSITSMVCGIISALCMLGANPNNVDRGAEVLIALAITVSLTFGIISLVQKRGGQGMAIAGIATAGAAILLAL